MRSLLWKEWHEQRWKLALATILLTGCAYFGIRARVIPDEVVIASICALALILLPVLIGAVLFAPEREAGTLETLLALPVPPRKILVVKTLAGAMLCIVPLLITCILCLLMAGNREWSSWSIVGLFGRCVLSMLSLYMWMLAFTVRLPTETRATLIGLGVLISWSIITFGLAIARNSAFAKLVWYIDPGFFMLFPARISWADSLTLDRLIPSLLSQVVIATALWFWASHQLTAEEARS